MTLAGLAGCLRAASENMKEINEVKGFFGCLRGLRVTRKPQVRKKLNDFNACGLAGLAD